MTATSTIAAPLERQPTSTSRCRALVRRRRSSGRPPTSTGSRRCSTSTASGPSSRAPSTAADGAAADAVIAGCNDVARRRQVLDACVYATRRPPTAATSRPRRCSASSRPPAPALRPLLARLADWVHGARRATSWPRVSDDGRASTPARCRASPSGPTTRCARPRRASTPSWRRPARRRGAGCTATSRRSSTAEVAFPDGRAERLPMPAVRGLATAPRPGGPPGRLRRRDGGVADGRRRRARRR